MSEVKSNRNRSILPHIINLNIPFLVLEIPEITAIILIQKPLNPSAFSISEYNHQSLLHHTLAARISGASR
ncbi:hypothetical protein BGAL_0308g00130 [Botrytis galanthina]|uniref:Uncharacterized protein n=1 Tax=Botrytis galanthina TaxID=278940 RepID=A0A4V4HU04_9HELO|nr:hypothetical protein BGAL_0308g00130 [Botrytis galanthina]